jgi:hypothetical protein
MRLIVQGTETRKNLNPYFLTQVVQAGNSDV